MYDVLLKKKLCPQYVRKHNFFTFNLSLKDNVEYLYYLVYQDIAILRTVNWQLNTAIYFSF